MNRMVIFLALLTLTLAALSSPVELSVTATGQETICFNYHPEAETFAFSYDVTLPLLFDPINSLSVMAKIVQDEDEDDGRITDVTVKSPGGTGFSIGLNEFVKPHNSDKREMKHGAVMYETDGLTVAYSREVDQFQVFMSNGFSFTVYRKVDHLDVAINNSNGVSEKARGLLASFIQPNAYVVKAKSRSNPKAARVTLNTRSGWSKTISTIYNSEKLCWMISDSDAADLLETV